MPSSYEKTERFIATDTAYFTNLEHIKALDPLDVRASGTLEAFQTREASTASTDAAAELASATIGVLENPGSSMEERRAIRRDFDKVLGHFVSTKVKLSTEVRNAVRIASNYFPNPRTNIYDYTLGNHAETSGTYTGDDREIRLIEIFGTSITAAHLGLHALLRARLALREGSDQEASAELEQTLGHVIDMHKPMIATYRDVGPAFVAQEVTRFLGPITLDDKRYEGPNPSHSGFVALDRFTYGNFEPLFAQQPFLRDQFAYRMSDMPTHLIDAINEADTDHDNDGIVDLSKARSPKHAEIATEIATRIRKFKVVHKSYADKGLGAKGNTLTSEEPDVLSESINFARKKES